MPATDFERYAPRPFSAAGDAPGDPIWSFTKFVDAHYDIYLTLLPITSDPVRGSARVTATIRFDLPTRARPVIEFMSSLADDVTISLDGVTVLPRVVKKEGDSDLKRFFGIDSEVPRGRHELIIQYTTQLRVRERGGAFSFMRRHHPGAYWYFTMSDERPRGKNHPVDDAQFLGRYLPTNLEFDAHPRTIELEFGSISGTAKTLDLFVNGDVWDPSGTQLGRPANLSPDTSYWIQFDPGFRSSSVFFYLADPSAIAQQTVTVTPPGGGQDQSFVLFGKAPGGYAPDVQNHANHLVGDFGRFPIDQNILFCGRQGMEYAGAAEIAGGNVLHELLHLFIGRKLVPAHGRSGWWDEAIAHWYVSGRNAYPEPPDTPAAMGKGSRRRRWTSKKARSVGPMFVGHVDHLLKQKDPQKGLVAFLARLVATPGFVPLDTDEFRAELEAFSSISFATLFADYVRK